MRSILAAGVIFSAITSCAWAQTPPAAEFVTKASIGNAFEIEQANLALKQASDQEVKTFAHMMVTDHTKAEKKLEEAAMTAHSKAAQKLDDPHNAKVEALRGKTGAAFDKAYVADQVEAHAQTAALLDGYAKDGDNASLKAWAAETLPTVKAHLAHVKAMAGK